MMIRNLLLTSALVCSLAASPVLSQSISTIESAPLQEVGPWGAAALPLGLSRMDSDLWQGADPGTLALAFERISPDLRFPSLQRLVRQAVFSGGLAPAGDLDLARARFRAANRLGPSDAASRLFQSVPRLSADPELVTLAIDAAFRAGRTEEACGWVASPGVDEANSQTTSLAWLETRATCYALNGEAAAANLSVDLARGKGQTDTWLGRAVAAISGPVTNPPTFRGDSGRAIALSMKAQLKIPKALAVSSDAAALSALVNASDFLSRLPVDESTPIVRRAAQTGVASPAQEAFLRIPAPPAPLPPPATDSNLVPPPNAVAPPSIAESWTKALSQATTVQARALEARLLLADLKNLLETEPEQIPPLAMPILAEAALWAGDVRLAKALELRSPTPLSPRQRLVLAMFDPVAADRPVQRHIEAAANPSAQRQAVRDALITWSSGMPTLGGISALVQPGLPDVKGGQAGLRTALSLAAERGSKGEVALLVGLALQGQEPASADAETVAIAVRALRNVGLTAQAMELARDYLLALDMVVPARATPPATPAAQPQATRPAPAQPSASASTRPNPAAPSQPKATTPTAAVTPNPTKSGPPKPAPAPRKSEDSPPPKAKAKAPTKPSWTPPQ